MWQLNVMSYVRAIRAALPHAARARRRLDRQRLLDRGQAAVDERCPTTRSRRRRCSRSRGSSPTSTRSDGIRCNAVTPGPTATGGVARRRRPRRPAGGDREEVLAKVGAGRPLGRLARARGDRRRDRLPGSDRAVVRDRRRVERRRRHRPDHRLTLERCQSSPDGSPTPSRRASARTRRTLLSPLAVRSYETRGRAARRGGVPACARRSSATATASSTRSRSGG